MKKRMTLSLTVINSKHLNNNEKNSSNDGRRAGSTDDIRSTELR